MIESLLVLLLAVLVIAWVIAPLESLFWWQRRGAREVVRARDEFAAALDAPAPQGHRPRCFIVYLSGIAAYDDDLIAHAEEVVLERVEAAFTDVTMVRTIYPYAADNRGLVDDRRTGPFWRFFARHRGSKRVAQLFNVVVNIRNIFQVMVSTDPRYGPVFSAGIAQTLWQRLRDAGYIPRSDDRVVLFGWSGGVQVGAGAAWYLGSAGVRLSLVSLGGIFTADPGLDRCQRIVHLTGTRDWQSRWFPLVVFPGRRSWAKRSSWNRARAEGRVLERQIGPFRHISSGSYLSGRRLEDGRTCSRTTSDALIRVIAEEGWATPKNMEHID